VEVGRLRQAKVPPERGVRMPGPLWVVRVGPLFLPIRRLRASG